MCLYNEFVLSVCQYVCCDKQKPPLKYNESQRCKQVTIIIKRRSLPRGHTSYITCAAIVDTYIITGAADNTLRKWDMTTCDCLYVYEGTFTLVYGIKIKKQTKKT